MPADVDGMSRCEGKSADVFRRRFEAKDFSVVAESDEKIIGYAWFSVAPLYEDPYFGFVLSIPNDAVYAYDGFIVPEYRLKGAWLKFYSYLGCLMAQRGRTNVLTAVEHSNHGSLTTHLRFGFEPFGSVWVVRVLGRTFAVERPAR
jgi:L-amino acid N-acyltransferase YncA